MATNSSYSSSSAIARLMLILSAAASLNLHHISASSATGDRLYACSNGAAMVVSSTPQTDESILSMAFCDKSKSFDERVRDLVSRLTLQEKAAQLVNAADGVPRLGIPAYNWWSEALHGVSDVGPGTSFKKRIVDDDPPYNNNTSNSTDSMAMPLVMSAVSFPQVILSAASFNEALWTSIGEVVSTEARAMYNVGQSGLTFWSPNVNIFRDPRWGRGQETPGEDPLLSGRYAAAYVRGLQASGHNDDDTLKVAACCKHYTAYDLDNWNGVDRFHFDAIVTKQDLDDTYQPPFKSCIVDGNAACVMCSYNRVNGVPTCVDKTLLRGTLRDQWGLNGYIASDCDSLDVLYNTIHYTQTPEDAVAESIKAGLNMNCGTFLKQHTVQAVAEGKLDESKVDESLSELYRVLMRLGFFDGAPDPTTMFGSLNANDVCTEEHKELALDAARQGIVLLKNDNATLPLSRSIIKSLAIIGPNANVTSTMIGNYAGTPCHYITPMQGLAQYASTTIYVEGCANVACTYVDIDKAVRAAEVADAVVLVMGLDQIQEREGKDRTTLALPGQQRSLITQIASSAKGPVILVIMSGGPVDVGFAKESESIGSMLWVGYPGEAGGQAIAEVIFGDYNPGGRLPMSWYPESYADNIPFTDMRMRPDIRTDYPGRTYRFYNGPTLFTFGHGLSYTHFSHALRLDDRTAPPHVTVTAAAGTGGNRSPAGGGLLPVEELPCEALDVHLHVEVTNHGRLAGSHVVLVFWHPPARWQAHGAAARQLAAFQRLARLEPGHVAKVRLVLNTCQHLSFPHSITGAHVVPTGSHILAVGDSLQKFTVS